MFLALAVVTDAVVRFERVAAACDARRGEKESL